MATNRRSLVKEDRVSQEAKVVKSPLIIPYELDNNMCTSVQGARRSLVTRRTSTVQRKTANQCCMESDHVYGYRRIPSWLEEQLHAIVLLSE